MPSNHLIFSCPLLLLPSIFPSIRVFSNESALCIRWPKFWSFSFNISPSNGHPGLMSFRMDWLDLLAVQGTLKSLFQQALKIFEIKSSTLEFLDIILLHTLFRLQYNTNIIFICTGKPKNLRDPLYCDICIPVYYSN